MASSSDNSLAGLETWAFRPAFETPWTTEAFARDAEALTRALQKSLSSTIEVSPYDMVLPDPKTTSSHQQQGQSASNVSSGSDPEAPVSKRASPAAPRNVSGRIAKRKSRASKRTPTTFITADPSNFRQMVQQVTGIRLGQPGLGPVGPVLLKPEPQRPGGVVGRLQTGCLLPTLDTSAFLLDHHQQQAVGPPSTNGGAQGGGPAIGFGPPAVVADGGGADFDSFSCFPTLESWKVM